MSQPITKGHGTRACYARGCRRPECRAAAVAYNRRRRLMGLDHQPKAAAPAPVVPLTPEQAAMVSDNFALAIWAANRQCRYGVEDFDEVLSDAAQGLISAVRKFDPSRSRFGHYATIWMTSSINRGRDRRVALRERESVGIRFEDPPDSYTPEDVVVARLDAIDRLTA